MSAMRWRLWTWAALLALPGVLGCGEPPPKLVTARGKILFRNRPLAGALVKLVPDPADGKQGFAAHGTTDHDGVFFLQTYPHGDGAVPGTYKVTIRSGACCEGERPVTIPAKYADLSKTPLEVRVTDSGLEPAELKLVP